MDGDFFFVIGIVLVILAVVFAFVGIRGAGSFPPSGAVMAGVIVLFVAAVGTTMAFAVVKSKDEQKSRNEELAKDEQEGRSTSETAPPATPGGQPQASSGGNQQPAEQTAATEALTVSSPADGGLVFQPNGLTAKPGNVTLTYDNPSPVPHSIALATANGNVISEVSAFTNGKQTLDLNGLKPGEYTFYCTVPGHREAGMEGDLTVVGGPTP